jgi:dTDP-glucose pyrophosphorylase
MEKHKELLSSARVTIKEGWKQLGGNGYKVLFITDEGGFLIGSVTDGDIRRWILSDQSILQPISEVMNTNPLIVRETDSQEKIKNFMLHNRVECLPVVDSSFRPIRFLFWDSIFMKEEAVTVEPIDVPVVIMAGGRGVRLDPFTRILPKPLIPIGDKPIIEMIIDRFRRHNISQFHISVNYRSNMIRAYFKDVQIDYNINFFEESTPLGTAGSLGLLKGTLNSTFMVSNCDILIEANYADIIKFHRENKNKITLVCSMRHFAIPYGVVEIENGGNLKRIHEKPEFDHLVNTGLYVLEPELLAQIPENRIFDITHLIEKLRGEDQKIGVYPVSDKSWVDVGELEEYKKNLRLFE